MQKAKLQMNHDILDKNLAPLKLMAKPLTDFHGARISPSIFTSAIFF